MKKTGEAFGDFEGLIRPDSRFSLRKALALSAPRVRGDKPYSLRVSLLAQAQ
jgi:hypothetical protein